MKFKEFLAMDNIAGKTVEVKECFEVHTIKIPDRKAEGFRNQRGTYLTLYQDLLDSECTIVTTTVEDFLHKSQGKYTISYAHTIDTCGWNKYVVQIKSSDGKIIQALADDSKQLEEEVCRVINEKFNLDLEPSNLDFLK